MSTDRSPDAFSHEPLDREDEAVLLALRATLDAVDPVPEGLAARAQFAMTVASLEAEVAEIVGRKLTASVRVTDYDRAHSITFASDSLSAMVTVETTGPQTATLRGWITLPECEVELREHSRTRVVSADAEGRFTVENVTRGLVHLVLRPPEAGGTPVITPTFEI